MVKLFCAIVGEESVVTVDIDDQQAVGDLKECIKRRAGYDFPSHKLTLYLAKQNGVANGDWMKDDDDDLVQLQETTMPEDIEKKHLKKELLLKPTSLIKTKFTDVLKEDVIHVLVELPTQVAAPSKVTPPLPTTTLHRHPERLKRWAAINAMIGQKNQAANQKTTSEDTNKKRKKHDIDKSVGYSTLCWEDIKPIYNFDSYDLRPRDIPDEAIELLLARIRDLRELYGLISDGKEAKRVFFIASILETVSRLLEDARILVEEDVVGKNVLLKGHFEFVLQRGAKRISIVEAKREDMQQGLVQNVTGLEALADVEELTVAYGIVTNFLEWKFLISEDMKVRQQECTLPLTDTIPTFKGLKEIAGKIYTMLSSEQ